MLTGALHDICPPGARLVGKRTYGKGLIQGYVDCIVDCIVDCKGLIQGYVDCIGMRHL